MRVFTLLLLLVTLPLSAATVSDLAFFEGRWALTEADGTFWEEQWTAPAGDSLLGMCRAQKGGKTFFYELLTIEQEETGPVMKLKHFGRGLIGREDKGEAVLLPLVSMKANEAVFERADKQVRLTYRRNGNELYALLEKWKDGARTTSEFTYVRK
ncbi:MAG TPA: DUF6265 family protein [Thermoanaerobaculia bacterium]|jgi:hypothetical protein